MKADRTSKKKNNSGKSDGKHPRSSKLGGDAQGAKGRQPNARKNRRDNILEWMSDGFFAFDKHMNFTWVNRRAGEIVGRKPEDLIGKNLWEEYPETNGSLFADAYIRARETQKPVTVEGYFEPWGRWFETRIYPSQDELAVFFTEITERKRAEDASKYSDEILNAIFEQSPLSVQVFSSDGTSLRANRAWEELWGSRREQLAGYNVLSDPQVKERGLLAYFEKALNGEIVFVPPVYYDPTEIGQKGRGRWTKAVMYPVKDSTGKVREVVLTHEDITESKQAEINIRQYADIVQNMQIGLYVLHLEDRQDDHSLRMVSANPAALQFSGITTDEVVGKTLDEGFPDLREQGIPQKYADVIRTQESAEIEVVYYDDSQKLDTAYAVKAFPLPDDHLGVVFESITERRQAEEKLRENETRLRNIIDNEPECIKILDLNGSILQMNPAGLVMIEADTIQTVIGKSVYPIVTPEYRQSFQDLTERVFKGESGKLEFEIVGLKGTRRWLNTHAVPMRNEQGDVTELLGITRDVTERRRAEEALRDSEKRFRALIENSSDEVSLLAADGSLRYESPSVNPTLGYAPGEFLGQSIFQLVHPNDLARVQLLFKSLMQSPGTRLRDRFRLKHKSGAWRWVEAVGTNLLAEPAVQAVVVNYHDITERKQAEEALLESQKRLQLFFNQSLDGFFFSMLDEPVEWNETVEKEEIIEYALRHQRITEANDAMLKQYGTTSEKFIGRTPAEFFSHDLDQARRFRRTLFDVGHLHLETEERRDNGAILWIEGDYVCMRDEQNRITGMFGIQRDITERRRAEEAVARLNREMELILNSAGRGIYGIDVQGNFTFINPAASQMLGWEADALIGKHGHDVIHHSYPNGDPYPPEDCPIYIAVREGVTHHRENEVFWKKDGSSFPVEYVSTPIREGGNLVGAVVTFSDTTERRLAEEKLSRSEERYHALFEDSPVSIWEEDFSQLKKQLGSLQAQGIMDLREYFTSHPNAVYEYSSMIQILDVNKAAIQMYRANSKAQLIKNSVLVLSKGERENIIDDFITIAEGRTSNSWEGGDETLMGEPIEISLKWSVAPGYEQDYSKVIVTVVDITERKKAERELQESEDRFRQLAGNIQEVFRITDPVAQKDVYLSPAYEEVWGRRLEDQMRDQNVSIESVLPEDRQMVLGNIEKQIRGKRTEMEYRIMRPDGSIRWIWDRAFPIFDESRNVKLVTGIAADITERKQAEGETLRYLAELQALYENGLAVGRLLSPREIGERLIQTFTHYLSWHHVAIRLRREESDDLELVAFNVSHLQKEEKEDVERNFKTIISKVGQGVSGWVVQTGEPVRTGNVHTYPQYVNTYEAIHSGMYMPLKIGERVIGCISVESEKPDAFNAQDERLLATLANQAAVAFENARLYQAIQQELFDRRHAEVMLEHERNSLAQRVEERTTDLKRAIESLARALRVKDEFLANMSHELRTPLNAILGLSESLAEQVAGPLNEKQQKYVTTVSESGHHLLALINDILDLAKIEAGQITLDITRVDMESVCQASLRMVKQLAQKKNQEIELEIDHNFGLIWADERRLKQMIVNLLSNAVKFTPENRKIGLEVHGDKGENRVLITVWDDGIGIDENDLSQLFKPFVQLDAGLAREASGTGLGLALVAQMARLHGGSVSVASMPGDGSRFTIVIPWEPALRADTIERLKITGKFMAIKPNDGSQKTILLIEDTKEVIMLIRDYLELAGYKVITAEDGIEGITQARLNKPDLILMDLQMPRMDGIEATQKLRSEPDFKYTPIIAITALAMPNDRERCLAAGMDEYISKPVNLKALVKIIQGFLAGDKESKNE